MGYVRLQARQAEREPDLRDGRELFTRFHGFASGELIREPCSRIVPEVLVHLGYLKGLIYTSDKGDCGRSKTYIHFMETPPRLASSADGRQLYIIGGNYRITQRGIEG